MSESVVLVKLKLGVGGRAGPLFCALSLSPILIGSRLLEAVRPRTCMLLLLFFRDGGVAMYGCFLASEARLETEPLSGVRMPLLDGDIDRSLLVAGVPIECRPPSISCRQLIILSEAT